ncbi:transcription factor [Methanolacinia petrolearia]|uniref:transcription factor n=1 Tax=Methanolacinia petrolearia TaxID=54120 RepID=UPI003BA8F176
MVAVEDALKNDAVRAYLFRLVGEEGLDLIYKFPLEGEYSDEDLAERTGISLNSVRHTLYTLYGKRLAEYRRIKNAETGWLTYLWVMKFENLDATLSEERDDILEILKAREDYELLNDFYICTKCGLRYTFDEAMARDFICINCDEKMDHFDNDLLAEALKRRVDAIKENLGKV